MILRNVLYRLYYALLFISIINYAQLVDNAKTNFTNENDKYPHVRNFDTHHNISKTKCLEYSRSSRKVAFIKKKQAQKILLKCSNLELTSKATEPREYPHIVAVGRRRGFRGEFKYRCSGSLISDRWVLTVAHCVHGSHGRLTGIFLAAGKRFDKANITSSGQSVIVKRIVLHPAYQPPQLYADLALLELTQLVNFTSTIKPACLPSNFNESEPIHLWAENDRLQVHLQPVDSESCTKLYQGVDELRLPRGIDTATQLCARVLKRGDNDVCAGDSGTPLQVAHSMGCLFEIVALASFGVSCGSPSAPGVYTKIAPYVRWIESIVWY